MADREEVFRLLEERSGKLPFILAIDGRCASGKTTLAGELQKRQACNVIHLDDFYLPFEKRTAEQMAKPGGNIDFERLREEVLLPLRQGKSTSYQPYNCHTNQFFPARELDSRLVTIVEGSYSCHPELKDFYDFCIFMDITPELQRKRLQDRNFSMLEDFLKIWIPREEYYFNTCHVREYCDLIIDNGGEENQ